MGLFDFLKSDKSKNNESSIWNHPSEFSDIDDILNNHARPQLVFKHSFRCMVSISTLNRLLPQLELIKNSADIHFIDVVKDRELSQYFAKATNVVHQSPQCIILHKGQVFWHDSHGGVTPDIILECLEELI